MWRYIRVLYSQTRFSDRLLRRYPSSKSSTPWVFGYFHISMRIFQCLYPWIFKVHTYHAGSKVGEFWRTRYLEYAEKVLVKRSGGGKKKKKKK